MDDSGSEYWGEIPDKWTVKRLKYVFSIVKRIAGQEGYDVLSITQNGIKVKDLSNNEGQIAQDYSNYQLVEVGDFAMNHMDLLTGWIDVSRYKGVTSPDYRVFKLDDENLFDRNYYLHLMQTCYRNKIFYGLGQGVSSLGRWRLQADKFLNFLIPVPDIVEQKAISDYINRKSTAIDSAISVKEKVIEKLESYKKSLIYECVTGKREVK
jgi:type I restriction enzyme S subunit